MPRHKKDRMVCDYPAVRALLPDPPSPDSPPVVLTVDEYEALRLIDHQQLSQEQCSDFMQIARTTVQMIYASARQKLALALVEGRELRIQGGEYRLCSGEGRQCQCAGCYKQAFRTQYATQKGEAAMRIAVTYENGQIFQHFGHTEQFKVYDVENGQITHSEVVSTNGSGHGALAGVLQALKADVLVCGGIGGGAQTALAAAGICLYGGVSGSADAAVQALLEGSLAYNPDVRCSHHDHEHAEGHTCGDHGCGQGHCGQH